jgi:hypothetical protein
MPMDARELLIVIAGLAGTFCLPWPAQHGEQGRIVAESAAEPATRAGRAAANVEPPAAGLSCRPKSPLS